MQLVCLLYVLLRNNGENFKLENITDDTLILYALLIEHIFSYCASIFRAIDIERNGKMDVNGIMRAKTETILSYIEIFYDCIIFGFALNFFMNAELNDE
jgi:hypothetical protein